MTLLQEDWKLTTHGPIVIKLGGSLLLWRHLPNRLQKFLAWCRSEGALVVLVTGGGELANYVRDLDICHKMDDSLSHNLAIRAMDLTTHCLSNLLPDDLQVTDHFSDFFDIWNRHKIPVLAPFRFMTEMDSQHPQPLPPSWKITSDSIAARIAETMGSHDLILLKSRDVPPGTTIREAVHFGLVDPMLPEIAKKVPRVLSLDFRNPQAIMRELIRPPM
ncbi:MAG: hypothetical protein RJA81_1966 [Planctomycetota bacterium]|jgi:aspartokinase-like uncharacterized kinase